MHWTHEQLRDDPARVVRNLADWFANLPNITPLDADLLTQLRYWKVESWSIVSFLWPWIFGESKREDPENWQLDAIDLFTSKGAASTDTIEWFLQQRALCDLLCFPQDFGILRENAGRQQMVVHCLNLKKLFMAIADHLEIAKRSRNPVLEMLTVANLPRAGITRIYTSGFRLPMPVRDTNASELKPSEPSEPSKPTETDPLPESATNDSPVSKVDRSTPFTHESATSLIDARLSKAQQSKTPIPEILTRGDGKNLIRAMAGLRAKLIDPRISFETIGQSAELKVKELNGEVVDCTCTKQYVNTCTKALSEWIGVPYEVIKGPRPVDKSALPDTIE